MKLTAQTISVRLPMSLVSRNIIHKFWKKRLANRRIKPCKESMTPKVILVQSLIWGWDAPDNRGSPVAAM